MALARCARCKGLFDKTASPICPSCQEAEDADFDKVVEVLTESPDLHARELSEAAGVDIDVIFRMIELGRIAHVDPGVPIRCGRCGGPAISRTKRLCKNCLRELTARLAEEMSAIRAQQQQRNMVVLGRPQETLEERAARRK